MPPERLTQTFEWEGMPGHISMETVRFEDLGGKKTRVVDKVIFTSVADRDGMLRTGMEESAPEVMGQLAKVVEGPGKK